MGFFNQLFDMIANLFRQIMDIIKQILPYLLIGAAIFFGFGGVWAPMIFGSTLTISGAMGAALALGASFLFLPTETADIIGNIATGVADAAIQIIDAAVPVIGAVVGGAFDILASSPVLMIGLAVGAWWFLSRDRTNNNEPLPTGSNSGSLSYDNKQLGY